MHQHDNALIMLSGDSTHHILAVLWLIAPNMHRILNVSSLL